MQDELEKYIEENRKKLDQDDPGLQAWESIRQGIKPKKEKESFLRKINWKVAAIIVLSVGITYLVATRNTKTPVIIEGDVHLSMADVSPELQEAEAYYQMQIAGLHHDIDDYNLNDYEFGNELMKEVSILDTNYYNLVGEVADEGMNDILVEALIENYELKIMILEQLKETLKETDKIKEDEKIEI